MLKLEKVLRLSTLLLFLAVTMMVLLQTPVHIRLRCADGTCTRAKSFPLGPPKITHCAPALISDITVQPKDELTELTYTLHYGRQKTIRLNLLPVPQDISLEKQLITLLGIPSA